jgi:hypothetical protein
MLPVLLFAATTAVSVDRATCESLQSLSLPETTILSATLVPAGPFTPAVTPITQKPQTFQIPVEACRVIGVVKPQVNFEVWMPASNWNGKFQGVGGGGFAGVISYGAMMTALRRGYATASTDTGHNTPGGSWALGHPELIVDFAYRAIHEMTVKSKEIVKTFYGNAPARSYFVGCSTGGRQGLMEAQRFPADYDGIVAGAPANYWTHLMAGTLSPAVATMNDDARLSPAKLSALNKGALAACDAGDGVTMALINNPLVVQIRSGHAVLQRRRDRSMPHRAADRRGAEDLRRLHQSANEEEDLPRHGARQRDHVDGDGRRAPFGSPSSSTSISSSRIPTGTGSTFRFRQGRRAADEKVGEADERDRSGSQDSRSVAAS